MRKPVLRTIILLLVAISLTVVPLSGCTAPESDQEPEETAAATEHPLEDGPEELVDQESGDEAPDAEDSIGGSIGDARADTTGNGDEENSGSERTATESTEPQGAEEADVSSETDNGSERTATESTEPQGAEEADVSSETDNDSEGTATESTEPQGAEEADGSSENTTPDGLLRVTFVDVGQGDGVILEFPDNTVVIDAGRNSDSSNDPVEDRLQENGHATISHFVVTHADADHSGGCDDIFEAFEVGSFYHPGATKDTQTWQECSEAAKAEATIFTDADLDPGDRLAFSSHATVTVLNIDAQEPDHNVGSIVLHVSYGDTTLILTGDAGCETESEIESAFPSLVDVDLLQVGHHGSKYSTCGSWLDATTPEYAALSVGDNNYGHPTDEVLARLAESGAATYRTDDHGSISFSTDGATWTIDTDSGAGPYVHAPDTEPEPEQEKEVEPENETEPEAEGETGPEAEGEGVYISAIRFDAPGADRDNLDEEWVEITNDGSNSVSLSGWELIDEADHTYTFDAFSLGPGASVKVRTGSGNDTESDVYWNRGSPVWNNSGDTASLHDNAGVLVDSLQG